MCALVTGVQTCALPISLPAQLQGGGAAFGEQHPLHLGAGQQLVDQHQQRERAEVVPEVEVLRCVVFGEMVLPQLGQRKAIVDPAEKAGRLVWIRRDGHLRGRSEEHTSELQSLMRISYAVFCLKKKKHQEYI